MKINEPILEELDLLEKVFISISVEYFAYLDREVMNLKND
jgi:hypothetical protein